jgi:NADH-quinone oxidoreductase subunit M
MLLGPIVHRENATLVDLNARELALLTPLLVLTVWIGVRPADFLGRCQPSLDAAISRARAARVIVSDAANEDPADAPRTFLAGGDR